MCLKYIHSRLGHGGTLQYKALHAEFAGVGYAGNPITMHICKVLLFCPLLNHSTPNYLKVA
jgi:hypothetical protein